MEFITSYIQNIAYFLIFTALIRIIIPQRFSGYVNLILGLILILILMQPFASDNDWQDSLAAGSFSSLTQGAGSTDNPNSIEYYAETREQLITDVYKNRITSQLAGLIEENSGCKVTSAEIDVDPETGYPTEISLTITKKDEPVIPTESKSFIRIETVKLGEEKTSDNELDLSAGEKENIKKLISDFYNFSPDNIHITVQNK